MCVCDESEMAGNIQNVKHKASTILYGNTRLME